MLWNCEWIRGNLKKIVINTSIITEEEIKNMDVVIDISEVNSFVY